MAAPKKKIAPKKAKSAVKTVDWRRAILDRVRTLIEEAAPDATEEAKWAKASNPAGVPMLLIHGSNGSLQVWESWAQELGAADRKVFRWLRDHALAGMPAPGVFADVEYDLDLIRGAGVTYLVTLTTTPLPAELLRRHGLQGLFFPIEDMDAPSLEAAGSLCEEVAALRARGEVIGFHCKAGYGRTGTLLAAQLIWEGADAAAALAAVRAVEPNWVQSPQQERFLVNLAARRRHHRAHR